MHPVTAYDEVSQDHDERLRVAHLTRIRRASHEHDVPWRVPDRRLV